MDAADAKVIENQLVASMVVLVNNAYSQDDLEAGRLEDS